MDDSIDETEEGSGGSALEQVEPENLTQSADLSALAQSVGLLFSPSKTFESVVQKRNWLMPLLVTMVVPCAAFIFFISQGKAGLETGLSEEIRLRDARAGTTTHDEEIERQVARLKRNVIWGGAVASFVAPFFMVFICTCIYAIGLAILQGVAVYREVALSDARRELLLMQKEEIKLPTKEVWSLTLKQARYAFKRVLTVVSWTLCVTTLVYVIASVSSLLMYNKRNLETLFSKAQFNHLPTDLMQLLPSATPAPIQMLASSLDVFTVWKLFLLSAGFGVVARPFRIPKVRTDLLVVGVWACWVLTKVGAVLMAMLLGSLLKIR
jgi:hypothetical protein